MPSYLAQNVGGDGKYGDYRDDIQEVDCMKGHAEKNVGRLDEKIIKGPLADEAAHSVDPSEKELRQNIDDIEGQKEERHFLKGISCEGVRMLEDGKEKE